MGQQTSTADRPPAAASRRVAPSVLAAVAAIVALLGAAGLVWWTSLPGHHVTSGAEADQVFADSVNVFDAEAAALPAVQVSTATLTNVGTSAVKVTDVTFSPDPPPSSGEGFDATGGGGSPDAPPPIPFDIFPGENCKGATIQPKQDCMVSVRYTIPQTEFHGSVVFTMDDGSQAFSDLGANLRRLNSIVADPYVVDFGTRPVGTTSPAQTVTISASPDDTDYQIVAVSVVDTVPTPDDKADYAISSDACTGVDLQLPEVIDAQPQKVSPFATDPTPPGGGTGSDGPSGPFDNCLIQVTDTPGGSGSRPAFLNVSYCDGNNESDSGASLQFAHPNLVIQPDDTTTTQPSDTTTTSAPPPPPDPNIFCPNGDNATSFHQLVALNGAGQATTTTPPTTTPVTTTTPPPTTTPPTTTTPPPVFTPTLTATPPLAPAGRTTQVSGTGFPTNSPVVFALVALGTATDADLSKVPAAVHTNTDGNGNFSNQVMLIMPHLPPGQYEILAQAQIGKTPVTATVNFLVAPGSQQPPKFASRH